MQQPARGIQPESKPKPATLTAQAVPSVHGTKVAGRLRPADLSQLATAKRERPVSWPSGSADADLTGLAADPGPQAAEPAARRRVRAGNLPVWISPVAYGASSLRQPASMSAVHVQVLDRAAVPAAWRTGLVLRLGAASTTLPGTAPKDAAAEAAVSVSVSYAQFAGASGADWASRLRLLRLPACALSTPAKPGCSAQPLPGSDNDLTAQRVTATVSIPTNTGAVTPTSPGGAAARPNTVMLALAAGSGGNDGDYAASPVAASSSWSAGGNAGDFSWSYPMRTPPALGGPQPAVSLSYSSSSVDGRSATTNNQPSWLGEGFDYQPGFVSRGYKPCADDMSNGNNSQKTGDHCWGTDNAVFTLNGKSGELIKDDTSGTWRLKNDDNSTVERLTTTVNDDNDHEYWKITTDDGTQYFFGLNRLPGYTGTAPANRVTDSVWTVPVAGNQAGEPCHATSFTASFCDQAWRWNLDYVLDSHGNTMSLWYDAPETNHYARNVTDSDAVAYDRGGTLDHIEYGTDKRSGTDTAYTATSAPMRVNFGVANRCLSSCTTHDIAHWPDTPWDQSCTSSTSCPGLYAPTFWTTQRLTSVTTQVWNASTSAYKDVDEWDLTQNWPPSGDGTRDGMWLESIAHKGAATGPNVVGGAVSLPSVNFDWTQLANRVAKPDDHNYPMNWMRLSTIWTDTGGKIDIRYTDPDCVPGTRMPSSPQNNTLRCYPVNEPQPDGSTLTEYFNKYLVTEVVQSDYTGHNPEPANGTDDGSPDVVTTYSYVGSPAWRHADDDGMTRDKLRTWSDFRGYQQVNTRVGDIGQGQQTLTESLYFQGMNGDLDGSGGTRAVTLPAIDIDGDGNTTSAADAPAVTDQSAFAGTVRQSTVYNGVQSQPVSTTVNQPWQSGPTATRDMGQTTAYARHTGTQATWSATKLSAGSWQVSRSDTTFDSYGMPTSVDDRGDVTASGDEECTNTSYARNTSANLLGAVKEVDVYALRCSVAPASEADVVSMTRYSFDYQTFGTAPTKGDVTTTQVAKVWAGTGPTWLTQSSVPNPGYDAYGRPTDTVDVRGNHTTIAYTPASGGPATQVATTTPLGTTSTTLEPSWGTPTATVDLDGHRTEATRDALGRTSQVWNPNHLKASYPTLPNASYSYLVRASGGDNAVTSRTLNANNVYVTSYRLYDGLARLRQTQETSAANGNVGTVFNHTKYDPEGRPVRQMTVFDSTVQPSSTLYSFADWQAHTQAVTQYDRAGRATAEIRMDNATELWRTTTSYGGDRINVTPPAGGTATSTITDARGRTTQLRQYHNPADVGSDIRSLYDLTSYHYDNKGQQDRLTDNAGNSWNYGYDLLGRQISQHDPDKGDTTSSFTDAGDLLSSTTNQTDTLAYLYDNLGRKKEEHSGSATGPKLAAWTYDPPGGKGQVATATRFVGTDSYLMKVLAYNTLDKPTAVQYVIPVSQTGLAGTYQYNYGYQVDGTPASVGIPAAGGLSGETLTYTYQDATGLPEQLQTNAGGATYVTNTDYTAFGELAFVQYQQAQGNWLQQQFSYDTATRLLTEAVTARQVAPQIIDDTSYTHDNTGNLTRINETSALSTGADSQCFSYDYGQRLTAAWTPSSGNCAAAPSTAGLGGPAPYWQSWTFDAAGDRFTQTIHAVAGDTVATSSYPQPGSARPHAVQSITTTGPTGTSTTNYGYDTRGNTVSRPGSGGQQTLGWNIEDHLTGLSGGAAGANGYLYDADGSRLIADTPTGTTLYLPYQEITRTKSNGALSATRYYTWAGRTIATRSTGGAPAWLVNDQQGTALMAVQSGSQATTVRRQDPYGNPRGQASAWPNSHGFVGGYLDATGLTHLGAREYDPVLGRFVSVDPLLDSSDPGSLSGYAYADNSPIDGADPTGMCYQDYSTGNYVGVDCGIKDTLTVQKGSGRNARTQAYVYHNPCDNPSNRDTNGCMYYDAKRDYRSPLDNPWSPRDYHHPVIGSYTPKPFWSEVKEMAGAAWDVFGCSSAVECGLMVIPYVGKVAGKGYKAYKDYRRLKDAEKVADGDWPELSGVLRDAAKGKGNFGLGSATQEQAGAAGRAWVGAHPTLASDGKTLVSQDGLRQFRPPSFKPNLNQWQANFESRLVPRGPWQGNGHLDITDPP
ncbi:MAG TPA: RHS repeat-associated core domain-containing protein [Jatrophihabitans sp.]|nr:RHS repeat-associated core domain-containing protein [Jatrophihabitans sp.]